MISMPCLYEETPTGIVQKDAFSLLLSHRIILLFEQITDDAVCLIVAQLLALDAKDPKKDIQLYINSPGGVRAGLAIYDTMRHIKADVATICVGQAASMGAFLLAAGTKGKRYSLENGSIMIHQALRAIGYAQTLLERSLLWGRKEAAKILTFLWAQEGDDGMVSFFEAVYDYLVRPSGFSGPPGNPKAAEYCVLIGAVRSMVRRNGGGEIDVLFADLINREDIPFAEKLAWIARYKDGIWLKRYSTGQRTMKIGFLT